MNRSVVIIKSGILVFVILCSLSLFLFVGTSVISNDGSQFVSTARNIANGNGFTTSALYYDQHFSSGSLPAPQAMWPPAFPLLLATLASTPDFFDLELAAIGVNLLLHVLCGWMLFLVIRRVGGNQYQALGCTAIFFLVTQGWLHALELRSESLFALLMFSCLYLIPKDRDNFSVSWMLVGFLVGAAFSVRYVGILLLIAIILHLGLTGLSALTRSDYQRFRANFANACSVVCGSSVLILPTLYRNWVVSGSVLPRSGHDQPLGILQSLGHFVYAAGGLFGYSGHGYLPIWARYAFFGALLVSILLLFSSAMIRRHRRPKPTPVIACSFWLSVLSLGYFLMTSITDSPVSINTRYLYMIILLATPVTAWILFTGERRKFVAFDLNTSPTRARVRQVLVISALSLFCLGQVNAAWVKQHHAKDAHYLRSVLTTHTVAGLPIGDVIRDCTLSGNAILTNRSQQIHRFVKTPTIGMTKSHYTSFTFDAKHTRDLVDRYGVAVILLFTRQFDFRINTEDENKRLAEIINELDRSNDLHRIAIDHRDSNRQTNASSEEVVLFVNDNECQLSR